MKRIFTFAIVLVALTACTALQIQTLKPPATETPQASMPKSCLGLLHADGNKLEIRTLPMAAKMEYVFFRMAAPVMSGLISGVSVAWQLKKAQHLP